MYRLVYYKTPRGDTPFESFLEGHNDKVPDEEIERALRCRRDFLERFDRGDFEI